VTEIKSLRGAVILRSGSTNDKINVEDDNDYDDDDDDDNLSAPIFLHIHNKNYFQCHKIISYIVVDLQMEKLINCVLNRMCVCVSLTCMVFPPLSSHILHS